MSGPITGLLGTSPTASLDGDASDVDTTRASSTRPAGREEHVLGRAPATATDARKAMEPHQAGIEHSSGTHPARSPQTATTTTHASTDLVASRRKAKRDARDAKLLEKHFAKHPAHSHPACKQQPDTAHDERPPNDATEACPTPDSLSMPTPAPTIERPTHTRSVTARKRRAQVRRQKKKEKANDSQAAAAVAQVTRDTKLGRMLQAAFTRGRQAEKTVTKERRMSRRAVKSSIKKQSKAGKRLARRRRTAQSS